MLVGEFKEHLDELAQPEALRHYDELWENCFESISRKKLHCHSFAASFILEMMGSHMR